MVFYRRKADRFPRRLSYRQGMGRSVQFHSLKIYIFNVHKIKPMRAVIQRVSEASVTIGGREKAAIGNGLLVLLGIEEADSAADIEWLSGKIVRLRIFGDSNQLMNLSVQDVQGKILVISQFTLFADTKKGNRPSFIRAAKPDRAIPLYNKFLERLEKDLAAPVYSGEFGADMKIKLINDGPVTLVIDSKNKDA
jgi:D-aminoacyl-tRNA deacylase